MGWGDPAHGVPPTPGINRPKLMGGIPLVSLPGLPKDLIAALDGTWDRHEVEVRRPVKSFNRLGTRGSNFAFRDEKQALQEEIGRELMVKGVPRGYQRAIAGASMRFDKDASRRDSGNYTPLLEKALGDALANGGWIPDDDATRFCFVGVEFEDDVGPSRVTIVVFTTKEAPRGT